MLPRNLHLWSLTKDAHHVALVFSGKRIHVSADGCSSRRLCPRKQQAILLDVIPELPNDADELTRGEAHLG